MRNNFTVITLLYPNGAKQIVKPNMDFFTGDWDLLALCIGAEHFSRNKEGKLIIKYILS